MLILVILLTLAVTYLGLKGFGLVQDLRAFNAKFNTTVTNLIVADATERKYR